jgi:hypothetical protein
MLALVGPLVVQQHRTRGWRLPGGGVSVARPGRWGNPWRVVARGDRWVVEADGEVVATFPGHDGAAAFAVARFARALAAGELPYTAVEVRRALRGRVLACFCPLSCPCHRGPLVAVANSSGPAERVLARWLREAAG